MCHTNVFVNFVLASCTGVSVARWALPSHQRGSSRKRSGSDANSPPRFRPPHAIRCEPSTRGRWSCAASDQELKAALFRFVDVAPACHSLDDLARHLVGFLEEVDDAPGPVSAAMRVAATRAGRPRSVPSPSAVSGTWPTASSSARRSRRRAGVLTGLWERGVASTVDLLGEATVTAAEADAYASRCDAALRELHAIVRRLAGPPGARARRNRAAAARQPLGQGLGADAAAAARLARDSAARTPPVGCCHCSRRRVSTAPTSTSTWSRSTRARRSSRSCSSSSPIPVPRRARRPASSCRPTCATLASNSTRSSRSRGGRPDAAARGAARQGRLLGP